MAVPGTLLIVPLTQSSAPAMRRAMDAAAAAGADAVEARLDYLHEPDERALDVLLHQPGLPVIATCRWSGEGGRCGWASERRAALLAHAVRKGARWADIELAGLGGAKALLAALAERAGAELIVSCHDFQRRPADLSGLLARLEESPGRVNKIAFAAEGPEDAWAAFDLLRASRKPALALAMGEAGLPSRLLARKFGAFGTFAALEPGGGSAPGQPTIAELRGQYRWDAVSASSAVYGVIGCPVAHSLSPAVHNAGFAAEGVDAVYVPLRVESGAQAFDRFLDAVLARPWTDVRGLSVTIPHKENALARVGPANVDELSRAIGAINTVAIAPGGAGLTGWNTDYDAAIDALVAAMGATRADLSGRRVAVLGAGGAARAIVAALARHGADTAIYNRTVARAARLAGEFDRGVAGPVCARPLADLGDMSAEVVINCTPLGMYPHVEATPLPGFDFGRLPAGAVVFDTIYNPIRTRLLADAARAGCRTVSGLDMFVNQAAEQYRLWTGRAAPREVMRQAAQARLEA